MNILASHSALVQMQTLTPSARPVDPTGRGQPGGLPREARQEDAAVRPRGTHGAACTYACCHVSTACLGLPSPPSLILRWRRRRCWSALARPPSALPSTPPTRSSSTMSRSGVQPSSSTPTKPCAPAPVARATFTGKTPRSLHDLSHRSAPFRTLLYPLHPPRLRRPPPQPPTRPHTLSRPDTATTCECFQLV